MLFLGPLVIMGVLVGVMVRARAGDRRTDLRRCPKCWYAMPDVGSMKCPECGLTATTESQLFQPRRYRTAFRFAAICLTLVLAAWVWTLIPGPWTIKVPRPLLRAAVRIAEPYKGVPLDAAGFAASMPNPAWMNSSSPWERLLWQQQLNNCIRQWGEVVTQSRDKLSPEELAHLVPFAELAHAEYIKTGGLSYDESWLSDEAKSELANSRALAFNVHQQQQRMRYEWALSELQYIGADYSHRSDWGVTPTEVIEIALKHSDPQIRMYGVDRAGRRAHLALMTKNKIAYPPLTFAISQLAKNDSDPSVRDRATDLLIYIEAFHIK